MALKLIAQVPVTIVICSLLTHLLSAQELPGSINTVNVRRAEDFKADGLSAYWIDLSLVVENRGAVRAFIPDQGGFVSHIAQKTVSADKTDLWKSVYHASRLDTSGLQYRPCVALEPKETRVIRDIQAKLVVERPTSAEIAGGRRIVVRFTVALECEDTKKSTIGRRIVHTAPIEITLPAK